MKNFVTFCFELNNIILLNNIINKSQRFSFHFIYLHINFIIDQIQWPSLYLLVAS